MANYSQIGASGQGGSNQIDCATFEARLFDALDGLLAPASQAEFRSHAATCPSCGPMFADIESGHLALHSLEEVAPPEHLVHNILAKTAFAESGVAVRVPGMPHKPILWERLRQDVLRPVMQPRFVMSLGMAFFSITLILNVAGVSRQDLTQLRPATAMVKLNELEGRVIKYYENLRAVYELESLIRDVKDKQTEPQKDKKKGGSDKKPSNETSQAQPPKKPMEAKVETMNAGPSKTKTNQNLEISGGVA